jgi:hypothetical protein
MITSIFLGNYMGTRAALTAPAHGRNVPSGHDHYGNHFTSLRKPPKKACPSSTHSRQQTLSLDSISKKELQMQNTLSHVRDRLGVVPWNPIRGRF